MHDIKDLFNNLLLSHLLSSLILLVMLSLVLSLLRSRRPPGSTLAWIFAIILIPYLGIPLYLTFGTRKIKNRVKKKKWLRREKSGLPPGAEPFGKILYSSGIYPPLSNSDIKILTSGEDSYKVLISEIENAKHSIDIEVYVFSKDAVGMLILHKLIDRAKAGIKVRLLVDAWGSSFLIRPSFRELKKAGGMVTFFLPLIHNPAQGRTNLRNHRKLAIFDDQVAIFGGMNYADEYMGPVADPQRWSDLCLRLEGLAIEPLIEIFNSDWKMFSKNPAKNNYHLEKSKSGVPENIPKDQHIVQIVASGPDINGDPLYDGLLTSCFEAKEKIWLTTPYFVPDEALLKALTLACQRGVDVKILVPKRSNHLFADLCRGSFLRELHDAGAKISLAQKMTHAKLMVIDDHVAVVGSANFDLRSLLYNYELGIFLYYKPDVRELIDWYAERYQEASVYEIHRSSWLRESIEGVLRIFGPLF